ncbi:MAG: YicC family protein [Acidobacteria bacterium]|nr:MAG: YicC family protein [Acidobacteriota bacterium]
MRSMTGFGRAAVEREGRRATVEVRSVNARGREVRVRLPSELSALEPELRALVQERVARGRVEVSVAWERGADEAAALRFNPAAARAALDAWQRLRRDFGLDDMPQAAAVLRLPGVLEPVQAEAPALDAVRPLIVDALDRALDEHTAARRREGEALAADIAARVDAIAAHVDAIAEASREHAASLAERIRERVAPLLDELPVDEARLAQEVAFAAQRADVTEELVRLEAHVARARTVLAGEGGEEVGRTLEFLVQEMRREATTIGSKLGRPDTDERTLAIKAELEKIREQAANLE